MEQPLYEESVFINCPYDPDFEDLFHAIVLTVVAFRFTPRCALESAGRADTRISRISQALAQSKYSIHDLSRFTGEGIDNLARFNMPLELGIAIALRHERTGTARPHNWLLMLPSGSEYRRFVSDLAGFDPSRHDLDVRSIVREVTSWLSLQDDVPDPAPTAAAVLECFDQFKLEVAGRRALALGRSNWPDILAAARASIPTLR